MGMIQSGINQLFSQSAALAMLSPQLRAAKEKEQKIQSLQKQKESITKARDITAGQAETEAAEGYQADITEIQKQLFETDPSVESFKEYVKSKPAPSTSMPAESWEIEEERRSLQPEQVMSQLAEKGMTKVKQEQKRRKFIDYLKGVDTSFGKFETLSPNLQKAIMKDYSKSERKKIMDLKDKEDN